LAIDQSTLSRMLESGALDSCLDYLRHGGVANPDIAWFICRLGEALFYRGRRGDAVECGRSAFAVAAHDTEVMHFCAWLFSNCGCHAEAAAAYERLIERNPEWVEGYRHASGAFAAIGDIARALVD